MKAYLIHNEYELGDGDASDIAFGKSALDAKERYFSEKSVLKTWKYVKNHAEKPNITTARMTSLDNCEDESSMVIVEKAIAIYEWDFYIGDESYSAEYSLIVDENGNEKEEPFFDKKQFEKSWKTVIGQVA